MKMDKIALLMHDNLTQGFGKMGLGMLRYCEQEITTIIDRQHANGNLRALTGIAREVPIVSTVQEAIALGAETLVPGVANPGGILPDDWWEEIKYGVRSGMSLVNGLHRPLEGHPELMLLLRPGRTITDVRREPANLVNGMGRAARVRAKRIVVVGTDMSIGKMTVAIECDRSARKRGIHSRFLASGQTGICIAGEGVALDAVRVDFASGAVESLVLQHGDDHELLFIEGQGSLLHPASTAWLPLIRGSVPTHLLLAHRYGQTHIWRAPDVAIPPLPEVIRLYEAVCTAGGAFPEAKVVGIATQGLPENDAEAHAVLAELMQETGLPATDVVRFGADPLLDAVLNA